MSNAKSTTKTKSTKKAAPQVNTLSLKDLDVKSMPVTAGSTTQFAIWVRALLQDWRQGTVGCKGRSDVARTNKKPWKQKGTGRARAGSARSPIWRGGGVTFGPQPRVRSLKVSKHAKKHVLKTMLHEFVSQGKVASLDWAPEGDRPKTSSAYKALKNAALDNSRVTLFVELTDVMTHASFANIPSVRMVTFDQANAFDLARSDYWVFLKKDMDGFKGMASQWT